MREVILLLLPALAAVAARPAAAPAVVLPVPMSKSVLAMPVLLEPSIVAPVLHHHDMAVESAPEPKLIMPASNVLGSEEEHIIPVPASTSIKPSMPEAESSSAMPMSMTSDSLLPIPVSVPMMAPPALVPAAASGLPHDAALKGVIDELVIGAQHILEGAQKVAHDIAHGVDVAAHEAITGLHQAVHVADQFIHQNLTPDGSLQTIPVTVTAPIGTDVTDPVGHHVLESGVSASQPLPPPVIHSD